MGENGKGYCTQTLRDKAHHLEFSALRIGRGIERGHQRLWDYEPLLNDVQAARFLGGLHPKTVQRMARRPMAACTITTPECVRCSHKGGKSSEKNGQLSAGMLISGEADFRPAAIRQRQRPQPLLNRNNSGCNSHHACTLQSRHAIRVDGKKSHLIGTAICEA